MQLMNFFIFITCHACVTMYWYRGLNIDHKFCCLTLKLKVDIQIRANYTNVFLFALGHLTHHLRASPWPGLCNKKRLQCTCRSSCTVSTSPPPEFVVHYRVTAINIHGICQQPSTCMHLVRITEREVLQKNTTWSTQLLMNLDCVIWSSKTLAR